jgi:hypothetical protein
MKHIQKRKICDSWYHQGWFRILLIIVAVDMIFVGVTFGFGLDIMSLLGDVHIVIRVIGGLAYVLVALFVIHYAISYKKMKKEIFLVCQHCAHVASKDKS